MVRGRRVAVAHAGERRRHLLVGGRAGVVALAVVCQVRHAVEEGRKVAALDVPEPVVDPASVGGPALGYAGAAHPVDLGPVVGVVGGVGVKEEGPGRLHEAGLEGRVRGHAQAQLGLLGYELATLVPAVEPPALVGLGGEQAEGVLDVGAASRNGAALGRGGLHEELGHVVALGLEVGLQLLAVGAGQGVLHPAADAVLHAAHEHVARPDRDLLVGHDPLVRALVGVELDGGVGDLARVCRLELQAEALVHRKDDDLLPVGVHERDHPVALAGHVAHDAPDDLAGRVAHGHVDRAVDDDLHVLVGGGGLEGAEGAERVDPAEAQLGVVGPLEVGERHGVEVLARHCPFARHAPLDREPHPRIEACAAVHEGADTLRHIVGILVPPVPSQRVRGEVAQAVLELALVVVPAYRRNAVHYRVEAVRLAHALRVQLVGVAQAV